MSTSKKGFDPLSSLFDVNPPGPVLPDVDETPPAGPADALPEPSHVKKPRVAPPPPRPPPPAAPDPVALARIIAKAAAAKAGAPKQAPKAAPPKTEAPKGSRLMAAPPPKKAMSVEEALAAARVEEEAVKSPPAVPPKVAPAPPAEASDLADVVNGIVQAAVPGLGPVYIANVLPMDDRGVLVALWRSHRARFASVGEIERAVSCGMVIRAAGNVPIGQLVAAHAVTDKSDYLIWVDLSASVAVAAFADARAWFGGE